MSDAKLDDNLAALEAAAQQVLLFGTACFKSERPDECAEMLEAAAAGRVVFGVTVHVRPVPVFECWAAEAGQPPQIFATVERGVPRVLN